jgi:predicted nucleic acid-binding protein
MKIVSDTGPLIGLAKISKIHLLRNIAEEVLIPPMVHRELLGKIGDEADQIDLALRDFIQIKKIPALGQEAESALSGLGEGEKQAIGLAYQLDNDVILLLDDRAGCRKTGCRKTECFHHGINRPVISSKREEICEKCWDTYQRIA